MKGRSHEAIPDCSASGRRPDVRRDGYCRGPRRSTRMETSQTSAARSLAGAYFCCASGCVLPQIRGTTGCLCAAASGLSGAGLLRAGLQPTRGYDLRTTTVHRILNCSTWNPPPHASPQRIKSQPKRRISTETTTRNNQRTKPVPNRSARCVPASAPPILKAAIARPTCHITTPAAPK